VIHLIHPLSVGSLMLVVAWLDGVRDPLWLLTYVLGIGLWAIVTVGIADAQEAEREARAAVRVTQDRPTPTQLPPPPAAPGVDLYRVADAPSPRAHRPPQPQVRKGRPPVPSWARHHTPARHRKGAAR
jgi:hypothetical protein